MSAKLYAKAIQKIGYKVSVQDFKIQNVVASCDVKFQVSLEGLAMEHHKFSQYDPELFPGLIYRLAQPKVVMLIFGSGKIVFTGAKTREQLNEAFKLIEPVLRKFKRSSIPLLNRGDKKQSSSSFTNVSMQQQKTPANITSH